MKNWLDVILKATDAVVNLIPGIPPVLKPLIVEAIQAAERMGADYELKGDAKKTLAMEKLFSHTDEPAINTVEVPLVAAAIDDIVLYANTEPRITKGTKNK